LAVYTCCKCLFCFERTGEVEECPDCAKKSIRYATEDEIAEYRQNKAECDNDGRERAI